MELIKKHILVVDDDPALRGLLQILLKTFGYTSDTAENGGEAMSKLAQTDYDAVLLDYMMPGITGLMVLQHIQQRHPFIPVVMITGHAGGQVASQALAAGARACLYKPFDCKEFENVLKSMLGTAPLRAEASGQVALS